MQVGGEAAGSRALDTPGPHGSEDLGQRVRSRLDIQQGHPLVLVATLPAMYHLWGRKMCHSWALAPGVHSTTLEEVPHYSGPKWGGFAWVVGGENRPTSAKSVQSAHLGVSDVREQLLLSLVQLLGGVVAVHGQQVMAKPIHSGEQGTGAQPRVPTPFPKHLTAVSTPPGRGTPSGCLLGHTRALRTRLILFPRG